MLLGFKVQNVMNLGNIVQYHTVFFKFDNGLYSTKPSGVIALCSRKITISYGFRSISPVGLIKAS